MEDDASAADAATQKDDVADTLDENATAFSNDREHVPKDQDQENTPLIDENPANSEKKYARVLDPAGYPEALCLTCPWCGLVLTFEILDAAKRQAYLEGKKKYFCCYFHAGLWNASGLVGSIDDRLNKLLSTTD
jgi:hypothetical protein